jgi:hypothetical protein
MPQPQSPQMSTEEIITTFGLFENSQKLRYLNNYDIKKIDAALDLVTPEKIQLIKASNNNCLPKQFEDWAVGYKDLGYTPENKWEIDQAIIHVQRRFMDMPSLLESKTSNSDTAPILIVTMVNNANPDLLEEIILRQNVMSMLADPMGYSYHNGSYIAHLAVSRIYEGALEGGESGYDRKEKQLELITEMHDVLQLENDKGESIIQVIERIAREWRDKDLTAKVNKAKAEMLEEEKVSDQRLE